jgi:vitellogenic carboxypeptidase-like protein
MTQNPWSWHQLGHVLVFDQPVGSGFAYTTSANGYVSSMPAMAHELLAAIDGFFARHPEYRPCPLYLLGESFAGKYIPALVERVLCGDNP